VGGENEVVTQRHFSPADRYRFMAATRNCVSRCQTALFIPHCKRAVSSHICNYEAARIEAGIAQPSPSGCPPTSSASPYEGFFGIMARWGVENERRAAFGASRPSGLSSDMKRERSGCRRTRRRIAMSPHLEGEQMSIRREVADDLVKRPNAFFGGHTPISDGGRRRDRSRRLACLSRCRTRAVVVIIATVAIGSGRRAWSHIECRVSVLRSIACSRRVSANPAVLVRADRARVRDYIRGARTRSGEISLVPSERRSHAVRTASGGWSSSPTSTAGIALSEG